MASSSWIEPTELKNILVGASTAVEEPAGHETGQQGLQKPGLCCWSVDMTCCRMMLCSWDAVAVPLLSVKHWLSARYPAYASETGPQKRPLQIA